MLYVKEGLENLHGELIPLSRGTDEQIAAVALELMAEYRKGQETLCLPERWRENATYLDGKHWDLVQMEDPNEPRPHTPVLWSTRENLHADLVDMYPRANPEPETAADAKAVRRTGDLINSLFDRRGFRKVWRSVTGAVLDQGMGWVETLWDKTLYNGIGDVNYRFWSCRHLLIDPFVSDIQESEGVFLLNFERMRSVYGKYPDKRENIRAQDEIDIRPRDLYGGIDAKDPQSETELVRVVDFYWREFEMEDTPVGKVPVYRLHWAKLAGGTVVERPANPQESVYRHGKYPFTPFCFEENSDSLFPLGLVDRFKRLQWYVDKLDQLTLKNLMEAFRTRVLVADDAGFDMNALRDLEQAIVKAKTIDDRSVRWFSTPLFSNAPMTYSESKANIIKDESGENQFARGEGGRGVTAASAIYALQEKGGKRANNTGLGLYEPTCEVAMQTLELAAEFYTEPRIIGITDDGDDPKDMEISAEDLKAQGREGMIDMRMRMSLEKNVGYKTALKNQQAIELMQTGMIPPQIGLQMMDFDDKDKVMKAVDDWNNSELVQLRQTVTQLTEELKAQSKQTQPQAAQQPFRPQSMIQASDGQPPEA